MSTPVAGGVSYEPHRSLQPDIMLPTSHSESLMPTVVWASRPHAHQLLSVFDRRMEQDGLVSLRLNLKSLRAKRNASLSDVLSSSSIALYRSGGLPNRSMSLTPLAKSRDGITSVTPLPVPRNRAPTSRKRKRRRSH